MAAAPADFPPRRPSRGRSRARRRPASTCASSRPRTSSPESRADRRSGQTLVGFAAETGAQAIERARAKLERKAVDAIVFNDVSRPEIGFDSQRNEVTIVERDGEHHVPIASKEEVADAILDRVEALREPVRDVG